MRVSNSDILSPSASEIAHIDRNLGSFEADSILLINEDCIPYSYAKSLCDLSIAFLLSEMTFASALRISLEFSE